MTAVRILLDTNVLIRALITPGLLGEATRTALEDPDNEVLFSAASIWERPPNQFAHLTIIGSRPTLTGAIRPIGARR